MNSPKPGDDEDTLPPLLPEYVAARGPGGEPEFDHMWELVLLAHSVMVYGKDNNLSAQQRQNLVAAFDCRCHDVGAVIQRELLRVQSIPEQQRIEHHTRYLDLQRRLVEATERSLDAGKIDMKAIVQLQREYLSLFCEQDFFMRLHMEHWENIRRQNQPLGKAGEYNREEEQPDWLDGFLEGATLGAGAKPRWRAGETRGKAGKTKTSVKGRFTFNPGQAMFDEKDLGLSTGFTIEVFQKLVEGFGRTVPYATLDANCRNEASDQLRKAKRAIVVSLKKHRVPCAVVPKPREGYCLCEKADRNATRKSGTSTRRATRKNRHK